MYNKFTFRKEKNMKEFYIKNLKKDIELTDFFMVKSLAFKTGSNGKTFLDITLGDMTVRFRRKSGMF